jgi:hypothetical protein
MAYMHLHVESRQTSKSDDKKNFSVRLWRGLLNGPSRASEGLVFQGESRNKKLAWRSLIQLSGLNLALRVILLVDPLQNRILNFLIP